VRQRAFRLALIIATALPVPASIAQPVDGIPRIGYLLARGPDPSIDDAFFGGMRELGYVEGKNIIIERRFAQGVFERLPQLAAELADLKVKVIVAAPFPAARAAKEATETIPIVMLTGGDPVAAGLVASLARPGGNLTGVSNQGADIMPKMLELLHEMASAAARIAVLVNPENPMHDPFRKELEATAQKLRISLVYLKASNAGDFGPAMAEGVRRGATGLIVPQDPVFFNQRAHLIDLAAHHRLPMMAPFREFTTGGGLTSYGRNLGEGFRRMATYVDKILKGARPGDLPIEQPTTFEFLVNLRTAKALGLTLAPSVLVRADVIIR
jgi:putative ABC transport system substrate-binding protein